MAQNPEFMAAIGKSFANQTATLSRMVEEDKDEEEKNNAEQTLPELQQFKRIWSCCKGKGI